jgi:hypothetical protein
MSAFLIGRLGSSSDIDTAVVDSLKVLTGSCFSSESAQGHHGIRRRGGTILLWIGRERKADIRNAVTPRIEDSRIVASADPTIFFGGTGVWADR